MRTHFLKLLHKLIGLLLLILSIYFVSTCRDKLILPRVTTTSVTAISFTTAVSGGTVNDVGSSSLLGIGLCWSTSPKPTIADNYTTERLTNEPFISSLTQLTPNTTYYVRAYATNSDGTGYGNQVSFATSQIAYPTLTTTEITHITSTTVISGGNITADNGGLVTLRGVCWGTTQNPTVNDSKTANGEGTGKFTSSITGLIPGSLYYLKAYATNSAGTAYGNQITFQTPFDILLKKENYQLSGGSVISTFDGGHIIFGHSYKEDPVWDWIPYIIKLDASGNRIWETEVSINIMNSYIYSDILETIDHNIIFCYKSYVVMLDKNGNLLWKFEYKTDERYFCSSFIESDDNNLVILASDELRTALLKISMDGKLIWERVIKDGDDLNYNVGHLLCKLDNGNYFLSGYANVDLHWRIWVAEINLKGDIVWENIYIDTYVLSQCTDMIKTNDGGIIITGFSMGNGDATYARVLKLDSQHNLIWEKSYFWDSFTNKLNAIIQNSNGDYVLCGSQGYQKVRSVLVKLDKDGKEIWKRTYWPEGEVDYVWFLGDLLQISDGGYILVGCKRTLWGEALSEGIWVKKVDQIGF